MSGKSGIKTVLIMIKMIKKEEIMTMLINRVQIILVEKILWMVQPGLDHSRRVSLPDNHSRRQLEDSCLLARCTWSVYQLYFYLRLLLKHPLDYKGNLRALLSAGGGSS